MVERGEFELPVPVNSPTHRGNDPGYDRVGNYQGLGFLHGFMVVVVFIALVPSLDFSSRGTVTFTLAARACEERTL
jgi:hypothetical protein